VGGGGGSLALDAVGAGAVTVRCVLSLPAAHRPGLGLRGAVGAARLVAGRPGRSKGAAAAAAAAAVEETANPLVAAGDLETFEVERVASSDSQDT
jgi:hypothetical protein